MSSRMRRLAYIYLLEGPTPGYSLNRHRNTGTEVNQPSRAATRAFFTVAGEHCITRAICRSLAPSSVIRRHCSGVRAGGRPTRFPSTRARSNPSLIR